MRGEMDPLLDKHEKFEELMASDMDHWLCNMYFEIVKLPRYVACIRLSICRHLFCNMLYSYNILKIRHHYL